MHSSPTTAFQSVWTLTGALQQFSRFAAVLGTIILLHDPVSTRRYLCADGTQVTSVYFGLVYRPNQ